MSTIHVQSPGLLTMVQDLGRDGYGPMGVSACGAADPVALRLGNLLLGNPEGAAGLEMTLSGGVFVFPEGAVVALTGADFEAPFPSWTAKQMRPGESLRVGHTRTGARCYLCVRGGIDVPPFLGSASTHVLSGLGGFAGRALRKGDVLAIGAEPAEPGSRAIRPDTIAKLAPRKVLRATPGPQSDRFNDAEFYGAVYRVTEESNRMGLRLRGEPLQASAGEMITEGVALGAIQVPPGGQPVILFVDQQTTGGYPKIANVITADLPSVGQLRPGDEIRFERVGMSEARELLRQREQWINASI